MSNERRAVKVLHVVTKWGRGGLERYVADLVCALHDEEIECVVASATTRVGGYGLTACAGPLVSDGLKGILLHGDAIRAFIEAGVFDIVHIHGYNGLVYLLAHQARRAGVSTVIIHSHNSSFGPHLKSAKKAISTALRAMFSSDCSQRLACSDVAGRHLFGNDPYTVVNNGVDIQRYRYRDEARQRMRLRLGIAEDACVVGFSGSLIAAKNPLFLIDIFRLVRAIRPNAVLLVCGAGSLEDELAAAARDAIESGRCIMAGYVDDVEDYYCAMDVLAAPSRYEGLPFNLIEAQVSNLPVVMSDAITRDVVICDWLCTRVSLDAGDRQWVDALLHAADRSFERFQLADEAVRAVRISGFSQPECFQPVIDLYREMRSSYQECA